MAGSSTANLDLTSSMLVTTISAVAKNLTLATAKADPTSSTMSTLATTTMFSSTTRAATTVVPLVIPEDVWMAFQIIHTLLTVVALASNCLSLGVIYGVVPHLTPTLQWLTSLAFADMLAPWAVVTIYFPKSSCQEEIHTALLLTAHNAAALSLLALAVTHTIATFKPLRFEHLVTQKRVWITINVVWIVAIVASHSHFLVVLIQHQGLDYGVSYCVHVQKATLVPLITTTAICGATVVVSGICYARIMSHLRPMAALLDNADHSESRKSTSSTLTAIALLGAYFLCWGLYIIVKFFRTQDYTHMYDSVGVGLSVCQTFLLILAISNPIIYGARMYSMQTGYLTLYHRTRRWVVSSWHQVAKTQEADEQPSTPLNPIESIC